MRQDNFFRNLFAERDCTKILATVRRQEHGAPVPIGNWRNDWGTARAAFTTTEPGPIRKA